MIEQGTVGKNPLASLFTERIYSAPSHIVGIKVLHPDGFNTFVFRNDNGLVRIEKDGSELPITQKEALREFHALIVVDPHNLDVFKDACRLSSAPF